MAAPAAVPAADADSKAKSDMPLPGRLRATRGCAGEVAAAYGGHPETAAPRMRWARAVVDNLFLRSRLASLGPAIQAAGVDSSASVGVS